MKVAYYSPLPPERSGVADYSALLLPALRRVFRLDLGRSLARIAGDGLQVPLRLHVRLVAKHVAADPAAPGRIGAQGLLRHAYNGRIRVLAIAGFLLLREPIERRFQQVIQTLPPVVLPDELGQLLRRLLELGLAAAVRAVGQVWRGRYRGQTQKWYALRFAGDESEIDIERPAGGHKPEFAQWRWEAIENLPDLIVPFKRPVYERVVREFAPLAKGQSLLGGRRKAR